MADLFGDWVPEEWIEAVLNRTQRADYSHHTYQFLTKNPKRLKDFNPWPSNCWVGTTITNQADADERLPWLLQVDAPIRFVSHEPLMGETDITKPDGVIGDRDNWVLNQAAGDPRMLAACPVCEGTRYKETDPWVIICPYCQGTGLGISWAIIGGMTGPGAVRTKPEWVMSLADQYQETGVPLFVKDNLGFSDQPQEFPA